MMKKKYKRGVYQKALWFVPLVGDYDHDLI